VTLDDAVTLGTGLGTYLVFATLFYVAAMAAGRALVEGLTSSPRRLEDEIDGS
jgi:hypothetical protein